MLKKLGLPVLALVIVAGGAYYFFGRHKSVPIEFGVPIYPGADAPKDSFAARLSPRQRERLVKAVILTTDDPPAKVIEFYKQKLGTARVLQMSRRGVPSAVFQTEVQGQPKVVTVRANEDTGKTEIIIGSSAPQ